VIRIRPATAGDAAFIAGLVPSFVSFGLPPWAGLARPLAPA
jgi:hypothetical protein